VVTLVRQLSRLARPEVSSQDRLLQIGETRRRLREEIAEVLSWEVSEQAARAIREMGDVR
jgi:hypothetical protein